MQITFESCSFWDALSAIGTLGATIVALWLALRDTSKRLSILFIWDAIEFYCPVIILSNIGIIPIAVKRITLSYNHKTFFENNVLNDFKADSYSKYLIKGGESKKMKLDADSFQICRSSKPSSRRRYVKVTVEDMEGKKYTCRQDLKESKLEEAIFGASFFSDYHFDN